MIARAAAAVLCAAALCAGTAYGDGPPKMSIHVMGHDAGGPVDIQLVTDTDGINLGLYRNGVEVWSMDGVDRPGTMFTPAYAWTAGEYVVVAIAPHQDGLGLADRTESAVFTYVQAAPVADGTCVVYEDSDYVGGYGGTGGNPPVLDPDAKPCGPDDVVEPRMHVGIADYGGGPFIHLVTDTDDISLELYRNGLKVWSKNGIKNPGGQFRIEDDGKNWSAGTYTVVATAPAYVITTDAFGLPTSHAVHSLDKTDSATFEYNPTSDVQSGLYHGEVDGSAGDKSDSGDGCTVWAQHWYGWSPESPPRNNAPPERSLYPGDRVTSNYEWWSEGCCKTKVSGPDPTSRWSSLEYKERLTSNFGFRSSTGSSHYQNMNILPGEPVPGAFIDNGYIHTAEYDESGRTRTHMQGVAEGHDLVGGSKYTVRGYTWSDSPDPSCSVLSAKVTLASDFRYRTPFWETSIHERHLMTPDGYPASNIDYSNYKHDSIPLEAGSNLVLGAYRHETIQITHDILSGGSAAEEDHCDFKTCSIELDGRPASKSYVGHAQYGATPPYSIDAKNPPWPSSGKNEDDGGIEGMLDIGEAVFVVPAVSNGAISIVSVMENGNTEVARGYNSTYQFVPSYDPAINTTAITNTALGGDSVLERPVSLIVIYNGTISDTLHYCSVGTVYDIDGSPLGIGENGAHETGAADAWGRLAGDVCPETGGDVEWGDPGACNSHGCTYDAYPDEPAATGWGRWSALNPETRVLLEGFHGEHYTSCPKGSEYRDTPVEDYIGVNTGAEWTRVEPGDGAPYLESKGGATLPIVDIGGLEVVRENTECSTTDENGNVIPNPDGLMYDTPYLNWDFAPHTDRDFVPACLMESIAAKGNDAPDGPHTNDAKPADWGTKGDWGFGETFGFDENTAEPHSYRGIFAELGTGRPPSHYVVDSVQCEISLLKKDALTGKQVERECVPRGSECKPEYDRRCEDVFAPYLYPDDYVMSGHERLQNMVVGWCGESPTDECAAEAYKVIDGVMVAMCMQLKVEYDDHNQIIDTNVLSTNAPNDDDSGASYFTPNICHNMLAVGWYEPYTDTGRVDDWRDCYGGMQDGDGEWYERMHGDDPQITCRPGQTADGKISLPVWDDMQQNVYVPYTPTTGSFIGVVERPGNMLLDDGTLTCSCPDLTGHDGKPDGICDYSQTNDEKRDLNNNNIDDNWDPLTVDGAVQCLDRTGLAAVEVAKCWATYGRDAAIGDEHDDGTGLGKCIKENTKLDGPDGECDPALIVGKILSDGEVVPHDGIEALEEKKNELERLVESTDESMEDALKEALNIIPFQEFEVDNTGFIPIPYVVDGQHKFCDPAKEPWCVSSGDTYEEHARRDICEPKDGHQLSVKRIPSRHTMPPLYQPVFDGRWPPACLPEYPVDGLERDDHGVSLDLAGFEPEWPTGNPSHVSSHKPGDDGPHTMMLHAGTGVLRFDGCADCEPPVDGIGGWRGGLTTTMGDATGDAAHVFAADVEHPPFIVSQEGMVRVVAVVPCADCDDGWNEAEAVDDPAEPYKHIGITMTSYPKMDIPVTEPSEMVAHECQIDGDRGTGLVNTASAVAAAFFGKTVGDWISGFIDFWNGMSCRDLVGMSITVQDYEAALNGPAAKREAGQPWEVTKGYNDVSAEIFMNGLWVSTMSILEHRGQCTSYVWSQGVTPGHTSCPATTEMVEQCMRETGEIGECMTMVDEAVGGDACAQTYVEDGIHKKWEFTPGSVGVLEDRLPEFMPPTVNSDVAYILPNGMYGEENDAKDIVAMDDASGLEWDPDSQGSSLLRCEQATYGKVDDVGEVKYIPYGNEDVDAANADIMMGGSFACQDVKACDEKRVTYRCVGGEAVKHVECSELAETYSVLDMPYDEVMSNVAPQNIHVETVCHAGHPHADDDTHGCDGTSVYYTHLVNSVDDPVTIYVDYFGVGELGVGRHDANTDVIYVSPPETFGVVYRMTLDTADGGRIDIIQDPPCVTCFVEHGGAATVTVENLYGARLYAEVDERSFMYAVTEPDDIWGAVWLYSPVIVVLVALYVIIRKVRKHIDVWE